MSLVRDHPFVVACLAVEESLLQRPQLERESRSEFHELDALAALIEFVAVMAEENVIALIVERHGTSASELGIVVEDRAEHSADLKAQTRREVCENDLGSVGCEVAKLSSNVSRELHIADLEVSRWTTRQMNQHQSVHLLSVLVDDNDVSVSLAQSTRADLFDRRAMTGESHGVRDDVCQLLAEASRLRMWVVGVCDENFWLVRLAVVLAELIQLHLLACLFIVGVLQVGDGCLILFTQRLYRVTLRLRTRLDLSDLSIFLVFPLAASLILSEYLVTNLLVLDVVDGIDDWIPRSVGIFRLFFSSPLSFFQHLSFCLK